MIIDSLKYNGICSCGKEHRMQTELCVISSGCLKEADKYLSKYSLGGYTVAVYDKNTYQATADRHPAVDEEVILDPEDLHANEKGVAKLQEMLPRRAELLIAVGSGTVHDLTRYCAYTMNIDFVSCPTAASVDGFCSSVAAMTWHGCKKTMTAVAPRLVIADIDVIKNAPIRLTRSGFGDMIGKYIALTDWKISNILTGEFYCERIADLTLRATEEVKEATTGILEGSDEAYEKLICGLLLSGLAMQMIGNSRPASGAEHHISHLIEMSPPLLAVSSDALHGEKVGVGTLLAVKEYERISKIKQPVFLDYTSYSDDKIISLFGDDMGREILEENRIDAARGIVGQTLETHWEDVCRVIAQLPTHEALRELYAKFGVKSSLSDIDVNDDLEKALLRYSHLVRNRLTLMRLNKCICEREEMV